MLDEVAVLKGQRHILSCPDNAAYFDSVKSVTLRY